MTSPMLGVEGGPGNLHNPLYSDPFRNDWCSNTGRKRPSPKSQVPGDKNIKSESQPLLTASGYPSADSDTVITVESETTSQPLLTPVHPSEAPDTVIITVDKEQSSDVQRNRDSDDPESKGQSPLLSLEPREVYDDTSVSPQSYLRVPNPFKNNRRHNTGRKRPSPMSQGESQPLLTASGYPSADSDTVITVESETPSPKSKPRDALGGGNSRNDESQQGCGVRSCFSRKRRSDADLEKRFTDFLTALYSSFRMRSDLSTTVDFLRKTLRDHRSHLLNALYGIRDAHSILTPSGILEGLHDKKSRTVYFLFHLLETDLQGDLKSKIASLLSLFQLDENVVFDVLKKHNDVNRTNSQQTDTVKNENPCSISQTSDYIELESEIRSLFSQVLFVCYEDVTKRKIWSLLQLPGDLYDLYERLKNFLYAVSKNGSDLKELTHSLFDDLREFPIHVLNALKGMGDVSSNNLVPRQKVLERLHDEKSRTVYFLFQLLETDIQGDLKSKIPYLLSLLQLDEKFVYGVAKKRREDVCCRHSQQTETEDSKTSSIDKLESEIRSLFLNVLFVCSQDVIRKKIWSLLQLPGDLYDLYDRLKSFMCVLSTASSSSDMKKRTMYLCDDLRSHPSDVLNVLKGMYDVSSISLPSTILDRLHDVKSRTVYFLYQLLETDLQGDMKSKIPYLLSPLNLEVNDVYGVLKNSLGVNFKNSQQTDTAKSEELPSNPHNESEILDKLEGTIRSLLLQLLQSRFPSKDLNSKIRRLLQLRPLSDNTDKRLENFLKALCKSSDVPHQLKQTILDLVRYLQYVHPDDVLAALKEMCDVSSSSWLLEALHVEESRTVYFLYQLLETRLQGDLKSTIQSLLPKLELQKGVLLVLCGDSDECIIKSEEPPKCVQDSVSVYTLERNIRRIFLPVLFGNESTDYLKGKTELLLKLPIVSGNQEKRLENLMLALLRSKRVSKALQETIMDLLLSLHCSHPGDVMTALSGMCDKSSSAQSFKALPDKVESKTVYFLYQSLETDLEQEQQQEFKSGLNGKIQSLLQQFNLQPTELLYVLSELNTSNSEKVSGVDDSDDREDSSGGDDSEKSGEVSCFSCLCKCGNDSNTSHSHQSNSSSSNFAANHEYLRSVDEVESIIRSLFEELLSGYAPGDVKSKIRHLLQLLPVSCCTKCKDAVTSEWHSPFSVFTVVFGFLSIVLFLADIGTDVKLAAEYFLDSQWIYGSITTAMVVVPSLVACCVNLYWYYGDYKQEIKEMKDFSLYQKTPTRVWILHIFGTVLQFGTLVRIVEYLHLGLTQVRRFGYMKDQDARLKAKLHLSLFECFLESAPQLLFQLYVVMKTKPEHSVTENAWLIGTMAISWASLALNVTLYIRGFREIHSRLKYSNRKSMNIRNTVVCFFLKLCETGGRVICLAMFASTFGPWVFVFMAFHVAVVSFWLCVSEFKLCTTRISIRKVPFNIIFGYMMLFCYVTDPEERDETPGKDDKRYRITTRFHYLVFYALFYLENFLMLGLWFQYTPDQGTWFHTGGLIAVVVLFVLHVTFQLLYYTKCCHPSRDINYCESWDGYAVCNSLCCLAGDEKGAIQKFKEKYSCDCFT